MATKTTVPQENWKAELWEAVMDGDITVYIRTNPNYLEIGNPVQEWPEFWSSGLHLNSCNVYSLRWLTFTFEFCLENVAAMKVDGQELFITTHPME